MRGHLLDRILPILRGITNVGLFRLGNAWKALPQRDHNCRTIIDGQRRLSDISEAFGVSNPQAGNIGGGFNQMNAALGLAHRAFDLGMSTMSDHDDFAAFALNFGDLNMNLGDERTGRIKHAQSQRLGLGAYSPGDAMSRKNQGCARRHLFKLIDKNGPKPAQPGNHMVVMDNFMTYINGRTKFLQGTLDNFNRPVHAGAKTTRLRQENLLHRLSHGNLARFTKYLRSSPSAAGADQLKDD